MEVFDAEVFVRAVQIVAVLAPPQQQSVDAENLFEAADNRNGSACANHHGNLSERLFDGRLCGGHVRTVEVRDARRRSVLRRELKFQTRRQIVRQKLSQRFSQLVRILIGYQPARDLSGCF